MWLKTKSKKKNPRKTTSLVVLITLITGLMFVTPAAASEPFEPVTDIVGLPTQAIPGEPLTLTGTVLPTDATNQTITWSVKDAGATGATITGNTLYTTKAGTVVITATIKDGLPNQGAVSIAAGYFHTLAIKTDGRLWAWGKNDCGQLGDTTTGGFRSVPYRVGSESDWKTVSTRYMHNMAIKTDGSLWAWGWNYGGQLGDGSNTDRNVPVQIGREYDWAAIAAGYAHTVAIKSNGSLYTWGNNEYGQLGDNNTARNTPRQVGSANDWAAVAAGYAHTVALKTDGSLWTWGRNFNGQLGNGTNINSNIPIEVGGNDWTTIEAGYAHTMAGKKDGSLWAWGNNGIGQLGDGTKTNRSQPVRTGTDTDWTLPVAGIEHSIALKSNGSLWAWGSNQFGQLGDGTTTSRSIPTLLDTAGFWTIASASYGHTIALKTDGSLWSWGNNEYGQLGNGTYGEENHHSTPVRVGTDNDWGGASTEYRDFSKDFIITVGSGEISVSGQIDYQDSLRPATVTLTPNANAHDPIVVETALDGSYTLTLPDVDSTIYTMVVTKPGYLSYTINNLTLADGQQLSTIDIKQLAGDVNGDGIVNSIDLTYLLSEFNRAPQLYPNADIDGDGLVNSVDLTYLLAGFNKRNIVIDN